MSAPWPPVSWCTRSRRASRKIGAAEVDHRVGAGLPGNLGVVVAEHAGNHHPGAERLGHLHAGNADAPRGAEHQHRLAFCRRARSTSAKCAVW